MPADSTPVDPVAAKRAVERRWPDAGRMARNTIRDEALVASHLRLAASGLTHDEALVRLYREEADRCLTDPMDLSSTPQAGVRDLLGVYRAVRHAGHGWRRALRCCRDVREGAWSARDAGELAAQLALIEAALGSTE